MSKEMLGFVGVGRMGAPMVERLLAAGHEVIIFDANEAAIDALVEKGAQKAASSEAVASAVEIVMTSLPMPQILEQVALGDAGISSGSKVKIMVDLSTTGPGVAKRVSKGLAKKDIIWIDCPVSGGIAGAADGTLALMLSGPRTAFERVEPLVANLGKPFFVGEEAGLAQVAKLGNNLLAASAIVVTSEVLAMAVKAGLDPDIMIDIINVSSGRNSATQDKFPRAVLPGTFDFGFATGLSYKDVRLCIDEAEAMGVPMVAGAAVRQMLAITNAKFGPDSDFTSIAKVVEEWAGVEIRSVKE